MSVVLAVLIVAPLQPAVANDEKSAHAEAVDDSAEADPAREAELLTNVRQLTFEGRRAGEGYFSRDGRKMVFQSEREAGNPFFQIYLMDLETGDVSQVSPGHGKTTCAWIHPDGDRVLFASTHEDRQAKKKQTEELEMRASGKERRYSWDYDEHFDIYEFDVDSGQYTNLTNTRGYDAEGSWSPDGQWVAFASNRRAYSELLTDRERTNFEIDPASMMDIFIMRADGSDVRRLTTAPGYDGGPFFSPDGKRICWRRFSENGATAEIMTMNIDGSDQTRLTNLEAMSWAPYYHPSGEYLIFTTNLHGFANFELYLIDAKAGSKPVRVTYTPGFDGLPVFMPDGKRVAWTTNRTASEQSQIFVANWDHERARELLRISRKSATDSIEPEQGGATVAAREAATESSSNNRPDFAPADIVRHVEFLCRPELGGRLTGTAGEKLATEYVAAYFEGLGLVPAGDDGSWYQEFEFTSGVALGKDNQLASGEAQYKINENWRPLSFSKTGEVASAPVVFAGYGIAAPAQDDHDEYDSYVHLDVTDKWVVALRFMPEEISPERRQHLSTHSSLRFKAMLARDKGARGLIIVSGPNSNVKNQMPQLQFDGSLSGASIPVISVTDAVVDSWLQKGGKSLQEVQNSLDSGEPAMGFELEGVELAATIDIERVKRRGRNVLARLQSGEKPTSDVIVVGAHVDHLGTGPSASSLARDEEKEGVHFGADDNASGVAAVLEIAEYLSDKQAGGEFQPIRDIIFAAWSGEELGLIGSSHFTKTFDVGPVHPHAAAAHHVGDAPQHGTASDAKEAAAAHHSGSSSHVTGSLYPAIAACLNLDMVGRLEKSLVLQGVGSSSLWKSEIERRNVPVGLPITLQNDSYIPTDASAFFMRGVPILSAFTGSHSDYHTPRDTPNKLNYQGAADIARFMGLVARSLAMREEVPDYVPQTSPENSQRRANLRAYLGTIPDYADADVTGVKLSGVSKTGPADKAGVKSGDIIVGLAGRKIDNIYDYTYAIEALKIGETVEIILMRDGKKVTLEVTPGSRD